MKKLFLFLFLLLTLQIHGQSEGENIKNLNYLSTTQALDSAELSPQIFLGRIANNPVNNNFELDISGESAKLQSTLYRSKGGKVLTIDISGKNENQTLAIFSGTKINPKVKGTIYGTFPLKTWISYHPKDTLLVKSMNGFVADSLKKITNSYIDFYKEKRASIEKECDEKRKNGTVERNILNYKSNKLNAMETDSVNNFQIRESNIRYHYLEEHSEALNVRRKNFSFMSAGIQAEGAKYNLFTTDTISNILVEKIKYSGWSTFVQFNMLNYNLQKKRMVVHSFQIQVSQTNNVDDLDEYVFTEKQSSGSGVQSIERKLTGYKDTYLLQKMTKLSYEINFYPMNKTTRQVGVLLGTDFTYFSKTYNRMGMHLGLNFPVVRKSDPSKSPFYISTIVSSLDPFNWGEVTNFNLKSTAVFSIRFAAPIAFNFGQE